MRRSRSEDMFSPAADKRLLKAVKNQNINVFVRVRPLNKQETGRKGITQVQCNGPRDIVVHERASDKFTKTFTFDRVFNPSSKQLDVYRSVVSPLIEEVLQGYNCTVFAYGQTGTGKTYTMEGERTLQNSCTWEEDPGCGIVPRALSQVFDDLRINQTEFTLRVSFLELYNEELFDLLSPCDDTTKLRLFEDNTRKGSVIIQGLEEVMVHSKDEVYAILEKGSLKRQTAATLMNAHSSRSHTIFSLTIHMKENSIGGEQLLKTGKLNLVDLAGSENIGRSGAVDKRAREAGSINQSLLTLGRVITALVEKTPHIPYRESKLTRLLQDSLGGKTKTSIIATVSPSSCCLEETLSTLDYAHRAKNITNRPEINQKLAQSVVLKEFSETIERLQRDLMAAREKNGVYLAQENYNQMTTEIQQQSQELAEKIQTVRSLREELEQKEALFNELNMKLNDREEELKGTKLTLESVRDTLHNIEQKLFDTLIELNSARTDVEEKSVLIDEHSKTEKKLTGQASQLVEVADTATKQLEKLHTKLDRHAALEHHNVKSSVNLKTTWKESFESVQSKMTNYSTEIDKMCGDMNALSAMHLQDNEAATAELGDIFANCAETICKQLSSMQMDVLTELQSHKELTQCNVDTLRSCLNAQQLILKSYISDTVRQAVEEGSAICRTLHLQMANMIENVKLKLDQQKAAAIDLVTQQSKIMCDIKEITSTHLMEQRRCIDFTEEQMDSANRKAEEDALRRRGFAKRLKDLIIEMEEDNDIMEQRQISEKIKMQEITKAETDRTVVTQEKLQETVAMSQQNFTGLVTAMESSRTDTQHTLEQDLATTVALVSDADEQLKSFANAADRFASDMDQALAETESETKSRMEEFCQRTNKKMQEVIEATQDVDQNVRRTLVEHSDRASGLKAKWIDQSLRSKNMVDRIGVTSNGFVSDLGSHIHTWNEKISNTEIAVNKPTGATPQRQMWQYPLIQELAATSPHERILARVRAQKEIHPLTVDTSVESSVLSLGEQLTPCETSIESDGPSLSQADTLSPDKENVLHIAVPLQVPKQRLRKVGVDPKVVKKRILQQQQN